MNKDKIITVMKGKLAYIMYGVIGGILVGYMIFGPSSTDTAKINGYDELKANHEALTLETDGWRSLNENEKKIKEETAKQEVAKIEADKIAKDKVESEKLLEEKRKVTEGTVVYEDDLVKINFINATASGVEFLAENKTDVNITFQADSIAINGLSTNEITMSDDVMAKSKGKILARCSITDTDVSSISGQLRVIDFNKSFKTYEASFVNVVID